jgi:hypothetical protein
MLAAALGLACCAGAAAQVFSSNDYQAREQLIAARHRSALAGCAPLTGHAQAVCLAEAESGEKIARAGLAADYRPSVKARHYALLVAADSRHAVARVRCNEYEGIARNTCEVQATAARTVARELAGAELKAAAASALARAQSAEDLEEAGGETFDTRYEAARLQCDGYVDRLRERCLLQTREQFRQP